METIPADSQSNTKKRSGCAKYFFITLLFLLIFGSAFFYWKFYYTYSDGYRTGLLQKLSHKGNFIKTWEGELVLSSVTSTNSVALASEKFYFSIASDSVANAIENFEGKQVRIHYEQKKSSAFWRGDSEYIVDAFEMPK
jgi:hypothetical protein